MNQGNANFVNRTLFHGDNLDFLKAINTSTIDLIATDPPFNKGRDFYATTPEELKKDEKKKVGYQDRWTWDETDINHAEWVKKIRDYSVDVYHVIEGSRLSYGDDMGAFLCFMAARLLEMRRVLKPTGSIYLHCDPTASHYLKQLMDAIFGRDNFRNEIIWHYKKWSSGKYTFQKNHDVILFYSKSTDNKHVFNQLFMERSESTVRRFGTGRIVSGHDEKGRRIPSVTEGETEGVRMDDVWAIKRVAPIKQLYPTQKPLELYKRIIEASTKPGDVVLDPFCGCATTLLAAEKFTQGQKRQWLGIDIWEGSLELVIKRLVTEGLLKDPEGKHPPGTMDFLITDNEKITHIDIKKDGLPKRTDDGKEATPYLKTPTAKTTAFKAIRNPEKIRKELVERDGQTCQGCDRPFADIRYLEIDHNMPRKDGGTNDLNNLVLLCSPCNRKKSYKFTLSGLRDENKKDKHMWVEGMPI